MAGRDVVDAQLTCEVEPCNEDASHVIPGARATVAAGDYTTGFLIPYSSDEVSIEITDS